MSFVTKFLFSSFLLPLLLLVHRLGHQGFNSRKTVTDPEALCGWAIPPRNPRTPFCRRACHTIWDPCRADGRSCTCPEAFPTLPGLPDTGRYSRRPSRLWHSSFFPFVAVYVETLGLAPSGVGSDGAEGTGAEMMTGTGAGAVAADGAWTTMGPLEGCALSPHRQLR